jgi:hypothetical protein
MVGHVRWQDSAEVIERAAHHGRKLMSRGIPRPSASGCGNRFADYRFLKSVILRM